MSNIRAMTYERELGLRNQLIDRSFLLAVLKDFNTKVQNNINNSMTGGVETGGKFPLENPKAGQVYVFNGKLYYCIKDGNGSFENPNNSEYFEEMSLTEVFKKFVRYTDIVNDLVTGGVKKCLSAEMGITIKEMLDAMAGGSNSSLAPVLRGKLKNLIFPGLTQEEVMSGGTTVIQLNAKVAYDPRVFVDGELVPSENYTVDKILATITFKSAYKKDVNLRIEDNFPNMYRYSVDSKTLLQNSKPLVDLLEIGDAVFVKGDIKAWDGGEAVYVISDTSSGKNSLKLSNEPELWANLVPNSNPKEFKDRLDNLKPETIGAQKAGDYLLNKGTGKSLTLSEWFISTGSTGWKNDTFGGGIYQDDTIWLKIFGDKGLYTGGNIQCGKVITPENSDYAEWYPRAEETSLGDIISLDIENEKEAYKKAIDGDIPVGVHSGEFAMLIGGEVAEDTSKEESYYLHNIEKYIPVGLVGRLDCKVFGKVRKGDLIVPSNIAGVGRVFDKNKDNYVNVVGMAVESNDNPKVKLVKLHLKK